jgi:hypothetical protein
MNQQRRIIEWHQENGGSKGISPAPHALRLLREVVELCMECGASEGAIRGAVQEEFRKELQKRDADCIYRRDVAVLNFDKIREEMADSQFLLWILEHLWGGYPAELVTQRENKLQVLKERLWRADEDGVLWRK